MKANKYTLKLTTETLSPDCIATLLTQAAEQISKEMTSGKLCADDGDVVEWELFSKQVSI